MYKTIVTYEQFKEKAKAEGLLGEFSQWDLNIAKENAEDGMKILNYKIDARDAKTPEALALANQGANSVRGKYNFSGGTDGGSFIPTEKNTDGGSFGSTGSPLSPDDFTYAEAPKYAANGQATVDEAKKKVTEYGPFSYDVEKPTFNSEYTDMGKDLLSEVVNREAFSYDAENDPLYAQVKKQYLREGERASQDALGAAAAATGGIPSSYAVQAAAQAGNYYAAQLADRIPELYNAAYNQYINENQMKLSALDAVRAMEAFDYTKHQDDMNRWNADKNFEYGLYNDEYGKLIDAYNIATGEEQKDYNRYADDVNRYNTDRNFAYGVLLDAINHRKDEEEAEWETKNNLAMLKAETGDMSLLNELGAQKFGEAWTPIEKQDMQPAENGYSQNGVVPPKVINEGDKISILHDIYEDGIVRDEDEWAAVLEILGGEEKAKEAGFKLKKGVFSTVLDIVQGAKDKLSTLVQGE